MKYSAFQIDESHRHNQNLVGTLHKGVPTVVDRHEKCCKKQQGLFCSEKKSTKKSPAYGRGFKPNFSVNNF
ncbi:MAG: hypothetical protein MGU50_12930 [Trichodesmium sp. MAG_R02]|nr:hypothetical protein [Trichodesmium sp. MAG_R02]